MTTKICPACYGKGYTKRWYPPRFGIVSKRRLCVKCYGNGEVEQ